MTALRQRLLVMILFVLGDVMVERQLGTVMISMWSEFLACHIVSVFIMILKLDSFSTLGYKNRSDAKELCSPFLCDGPLLTTILPRDGPSSPSEGHQKADGSHIHQQCVPSGFHEYPTEEHLAVMVESLA